MNISPNKHRQRRLKNRLVTLVLLAGLVGLAWLSKHYTVQTDITGNAANTLSSASQKVLATLPEKVQITAYIKKGLPIRAQISQLIDRYRLYKPDLSLTFVDPESQPEKVRELNIGSEGVVIVDYHGRTEKLKFVDESALTNALIQLANVKGRLITFLAGHGERSPDGVANFDLGEFSKELARRNIKSQTVNLATLPVIPDNAALLVVSAPAVPLLPGEITIIDNYIKQGGNLLLLTDPDNQWLSALEQPLGIRQLQGTIVDSSSKLYGINDPSFILASEYVHHPVTQGFQTITLYPTVSALEIDKVPEYRAEVLFSSGKQSWTETGTLSGDIHFDATANEKQGPLAFAVALTSNRGETEQRIIVVGDGDFLSNTYIGNVGNLDMGLRMVNWLVHDDRFIEIPARTATDNKLQLTQTAVAVMGFGFLLALPVTLIGTGFFIWRKRKQR